MYLTPILTKVKEEIEEYKSRQEADRKKIEEMTVQLSEKDKEIERYKKLIEAHTKMSMVIDTESTVDTTKEVKVSVNEKEEARREYKREWARKRRAEQKDS